MGMFGNRKTGNVFAPNALREYQPTARDRAANALRGVIGDGYQRNLFVENLLGSSGLGHSKTGLIDYTPLGAMFQGDEGGRKVANGNIFGGAADIGLAALPLPAAAKGAKGMFGKVGNPEARAKFLALVEETRNRERQADQWASAAKPMRFFSDDGRSSLVSPDVGRPGGWRVTAFSRNGEPWGHQEFDTAQEAFRDAHRGSFSPTKPPPRVSVKESRGRGMYDVHYGEEKAGEITLAPGGNFVDRAEVRPEFRRRGIASAAYDALEKDIGRPLVPSPLGLSDEATALWRKRLAAMQPEQRDALLREAWETGRSYGIRDEHLAGRLDPLR